ncbi:MAG: phosphotransferase [Anaerolineae bacterium]|nr:phosphotransferase [Anaerolineae bacterium]
MEISKTVLAAGAAAFALDPAALRVLGAGSGADGVTCMGERDGVGVVLKFLPSTAERLPWLVERNAFACYLREHGVAVPRRLPSVQGELVEVVEEAGATFAVTMTERAAGHPPNLYKPAEWNEHFFRRWGALVGQMHALTKDYTGGASLPDWQDEHASFVQMCADLPVRERWIALGETLRALPQDRDCFGLIHNDPHAWNFLVSGDAVTVLDFDVCNHHWFMTDIGIAMFQPLWALQSQPRFRPQLRDIFRRMYDGFMIGYSAHNTLSEEWLARLPLFMRYRRMLFYIVLAQEAQPDQWTRQQIPVLRRAILSDAPLPGFAD